MADQLKRDDSPFHVGERKVQARLGVRAIEDRARKVVRDHMSKQHREFHTNQPFLVVAARDERERPWATLLTGPDGFATSPNPRRLDIEAKPAPGDALDGVLSSGADIGILGIELATRRRNRVNGRVLDSGSSALRFGVEQAFGNCPQYIHEREWVRVSENSPGEPSRGPCLTLGQSNLIAAADTFFIASGYRGMGDSPTYGMDASHRGGDPGFVEILGDRRIRFPDYAGNNHYNTIGNLVLDPRAGFLFVDFGTGSLLQLTGTTSIDWDSEEIARFPGARRLVTVDVEEVVELPSTLNLRWRADALASTSIDQ